MLRAIKGDRIEFTAESTIIPVGSQGTVTEDLGDCIYVKFDFLINEDDNPWPVFRDEFKVIPKSAKITPSIAKDIALSPGTKTILLHLEKRGTISPMEALHAYNTLRLAPRIHELRNAGYSITTTMNEDGAGHKYARYHLQKAA
jgi:hypothetical protein